MYINVILSFKSFNDDGDSQEIFDLNLPINKNEQDAISFLKKKLFKRIASKCKYYGRDVKDLFKISTAGDWEKFEEITSKKSLPGLGHNCKWFFNEDINELDSWERSLKAEYKFGKNI